MKRFELFFAFLLVPIDALAVVVAFVLAYYTRSHLYLAADFFHIGFKEYLRYAFYLVPIWVVLFSFSGLYDLETVRKSSSRFARIVVASSTAMLLFVMVIFLSKSFFFSRFILIFTWVFSILTLTFARSVYDTFRHLVLRWGIGRRRLMLVGNNGAIHQILGYIRTREQYEYDLIGMVCDDEMTDKNIPDLGETKDIEKIIADKLPDELILTDADISKKKMLSIMQICYDLHVNLRYVPDAFSLVSANFKPTLIGSMPVMELRQIPLDGWGRIIKRLIDIALSLVALIVASPFMLFVAILEKLTSRGPIIYSHQRVGRDGGVFMLHKFRSMYQNAENKSGRYWTEANDDRITPLGKIIRKINLDELPQFWNIFVGEMSFVGPRPEQPRFVEKFSAELPDYFRRHRVKVGLTGWAQVNGLKGDTSIEERVKYDIYYIENWSLWLDIKILFKTIYLVGYETFLGKYEYRPHS